VQGSPWRDDLHLKQPTIAEAQATQGELALLGLEYLELGARHAPRTVI
jgi:hypothetical protein